MKRVILKVDELDDVLALCKVTILLHKMAQLHVNYGPITWKLSSKQDIDMTP